MYSYPKTTEEYWKIVEEYWDNISSILHNFLPPTDVALAESYRKEQNKEIVSLFNNAWHNAPDSPTIHSIPSWFIFCDLCSESYVLYDDEEE